LKAGKEVVFCKGSLFEAIRASISLPSFYAPVVRDDMILIDGGVMNPIPLNRVKRHAGDILVGIDVSGHDYKSQWEEMRRLSEWQKNDKSLKAKILDKLLPDNLDFNYYTLLSRTSSLIIRQNSILMTKLMKPEMLADIQMSRYGSFDYDKSEKIIAIGRLKTAIAISKYEHQLGNY
jgi:NTE family protein